MKQVEEVTVREGDHETTLIIPKSDDRQYDEYIKEAEIEKTREQLRNKPPRKSDPEKTKVLAEHIKEYQERLRRKQEHAGSKKYY